MANRFARKTGNWNAADVWSDTPSGTAGAQFIPVAGDVAMVNSFTVTINVDATCAEVRTTATSGATAGGGFTLADGVTLTANCYAGTTSCVTFSGNAPAVGYVVGSGYGGSANNTRAFVISNSGALTVTGNLFASAYNNGSGAYIASGGTFNLTGSATGGPGNTNSFCIYNALSGTVNVTGNLFGGSVDCNVTGCNAGCYNNNVGTINMTGNVTGGGGVNSFGLFNYISGTINFFGGGLITAGANCIGLNNYSTGLVSGIAAAISVNGYFPFAGRIKFAKPLSSNFYIDVQNVNNETVRIYPATTLVASSPAPTDVRSGTTYQEGGQTGTCAVPPAASVLYGVPVDATTGTAQASVDTSAIAASVWAYGTRELTSASGLDAAGVRAALGMAAADLDAQLDALSAQVDTIGSGTGAALNFAASADNTAAPIEGVTFVGSQVNSYASTGAEDGTRHELTDSGGTPDLDIVYRFDVGAGRNAAKLVWKGYVTNGDTVIVQAFNGITWDTRASITGTVGATNITRDIPLLAQHTGVGINAGRVLLRFLATGQSAIIVRTDEMLVAGVAVGMSAGYQDGAVWVDTVNGIAGITPFIHGVADAPVNSWTDALAIAASVGLSRFHIIAGSSIVLTGDSSHYTLMGDGLWNLDLGGQNIANIYILRASISGTSTGAGVILEDCQILPDVSTGPAYFIRCGLATTVGHPYLAAESGQYVFSDCISLVAGSGVPYFDFSGTGGVIGANIRRWSGGVNIVGNTNVTGTVEVLGGGNQTIVAGGGSWEIRGICRELNLDLSGSSVIRFSGITGSVGITGSAGTVRLYGITGIVTDATNGAVVIDQQAVNRDIINTVALSQADIAEVFGAFWAQG